MQGRGRQHLRRVESNVQGLHRRAVPLPEVETLDVMVWIDEDLVLLKCSMSAHDFLPLLMGTEGIP